MINNAKCFIKIDEGIYEEITYDELERRRKLNNTYKAKKFIPIQGNLIEVSEDEYKKFYQDVEKIKYTKR